MRNNLIETVMGAVVLVVAALFIVFAYNKAEVGKVEGYEIVAKFDRVDGILAGRAMVPSGASTGQYEALELRDNNSDYFGKSVNNAINNVNSIIAPALIGNTSNDIYDIDRIMLDLDNTDNKAYLGANAMLGVSLASLKAFSISNNVHK